MRARQPYTLASLSSRAMARVHAEAPISPARAARPLATSSPRRLPRVARQDRVRNASSTTPPVTEPTASAPPDDPAAPTEDDIPPEPPSFPAIVTTLTAPGAPSGPLPSEHELLFNHLATSFISANQPCTSPTPVDRGPPQMLMDAGARGLVVPPAREESRDVTPRATGDDPVIALVCPFEGGDAYISRAVNEVAAHLSADVVRLDLALGVGFDGPFAPLAETGISAPSIAQSGNPLFQTPNNDHGSMQHEEEEMGGEEEESGMPNVIRIPMVAAMPGGGPFGMPPGRQRPENEEEWVQFFSGLINMQLPDGEPAQRRIILLESVAAMGETFEVWWPSLLEAVRRRRRGPSSRGKPKRNPTTTQPTTIILSAPPSLLLPHTAPMSDIGGGGLEENKDKIRSVVEALGASVSAIHVDGGDKGEERLWWSSEEHDNEGRQKRDERRLKAILNHGPSALLPFGSASAHQPSGSSTPHPILDMLMGRKKSKDDVAVNASLVWKAIPIIPATRDIALEQHERTLRRRAVNAALMMRAVGQLGATLEEPLAMLEAPGSDPARGRERRMKRRRELDPEWSEYVISWKDAVDVGSTAVGRAAIAAPSADAALVLNWNDIQAARAVTFDHESHINSTVGRYLTASEIVDRHKRAKTETSSGDPVINQVKHAKDLSKHEKRLLPCIVDSKKLAATSFKDVHLPYKTVDAIRTVISLPLLFPDAFAGGILKDHITSGALLFGPPGTGKTLLARAIAAESGARMLAIQPSDVNDMWVGEGEKLVKAVFNLARRLSPCVVFIDEVDSLFGARSARDSGGGSKAHNQVLTEFMQEMDGLSSSTANREKRIVVLGATNRPFDLDDAILRRLPRRLLVDLPTAEDRKAILEILLRDEHLATDVNLEQLAKKTEGFSGSDLKHLCVAAALAAVKDMVEVPWKAGTGKEIPTAAVVATPVTPPPGGARDGHVLTLEEEPEAVKAEPVAEPLSPAAKVVEAAYLEQLEAGARAEADARGEEHKGKGHASTETVESTVAAQADTPGPDGDMNTPPPQPEAEEKENTLVQKRLVTAKHFTSALSEIRPSSSEEGTLPELRKWAALYGEGGKEKGKKSGFGKGFGFGEEARSSGKGFGRVNDGEKST